MLQRSPRRRSPLIGSRRIKPPHPSPSPRRRTTNNKSRPPVKILKRCSSAPVLLYTAEDEVDDHSTVRSGGSLFRPQTFSYAFLSSPSLFVLPSPYNSPSNKIQGYYDNDVKVVVNVTVEGSPGPVQTMVKLGSTVDNTIRCVVDKYREEGRSPKLDPNGESSFQLHHSYFSLQSLDRSEVIGDVGSRSFYLRKSNHASTSNSFNAESAPKLVMGNSASAVATPPLLLTSFIARKISKIVRRARRLWKIVVCSQ